MIEATTEHACHEPGKTNVTNRRWLSFGLKAMRAVAHIILLFCIAGCVDQDPLNLSQRKVAGRYMLERFESGKFYLREKGTVQDVGGCIEGTVKAIGWTNSFIFAKRSSLYRGDPDGWMVIDVAKQSIIGPLAEEEFRKQYPGVQILSPEEAWKKL